MKVSHFNVLVLIIICFYSCKDNKQKLNEATSVKMPVKIDVYNQLGKFFVNPIDRSLVAASLGNYELAEMTLKRAQLKVKRTHPYELNMHLVLLNNLAFLYGKQKKIKERDSVRKEAENLIAIMPDKEPIVSMMIFGNLPIIDLDLCKKLNGGSPPFNPDPSTGGSMAYCDGMGGVVDGSDWDWGDDWDDGGDWGGGRDGGGNGGGSEPDPDPEPEPDDDSWMDNCLNVHLGGFLPEAAVLRECWRPKVEEFCRKYRNCTGDAECEIHAHADFEQEEALWNCAMNNLQVFIGQPAE